MNDHLLGDPFEPHQPRIGETPRHRLFGLLLLIALATLFGLGKLVAADRAGHWVMIGQHVEAACPEALRPICPGDCRKIARVCYPTVQLKPEDVEPGAPKTNQRRGSSTINAA